MEEIKKLVKEKKVSIGAEQTIKNLKLGRLSRVFVASNCPADTKEDVRHYAELSETEVVELDIPNDELGLVCRKPYSISVLGVIRG